MGASEFALVFYGNISNVNCTADNTFTSHDPEGLLIPITILYILIFSTGVIGNTITCIVIRKNKQMHTTMNYYRFNLAVADLMFLCTVLPLLMFLLWAANPSVSPVAKVFYKAALFIQETSSIASVLTITAFTVERYLAVCHPLLWHTASKFSRTVVLIMVAWVVAVPFGIFVTFWSYVVSHPLLVYQSCNYDQKGVQATYEVSAVLFCAIPFVVITVLCVLIGRNLRIPRRTSKGDQEAQLTSRRIFKVLLAIIVAFFTCLVPFHTFRLMRVSMIRYGAHSTTVAQAYFVIKYTSRIFYISSGAINPILYNVMSKNFREAFRQTLSLRFIHRLWKPELSTSVAGYEVRKDRTMETGSSQV